MVKRLTASSVIGDKKRPKKNNKNVWTPEEIEEQRRLFQNISNDDDSDYQEQSGSNESPSIIENRKNNSNGVDQN